jgi:ribosomal protein L7/L12
MPQIKVFQCPSCGASLSYEGGPELTITCQFCGSNVIVPAELRDQAASVPVLDLAKLAELKRLALGGQKIEAIELYRQMFDVGLKEAKDAVEKLEAGEPLVVTSVSATSSGASADQAARLAEVAQLLRAGQKIEAIKLYRQTFDVGLKKAKDAVEAMEAGPGGGLDSGLGRAVSVTQAKRAAKSIGCVSTGVGALVVIAIVGFVLAMVFGLPFRLSGSYRQALDAARSNPAVVEALGAPVEASWWPILGELSCGSSCSADYEFRIHGSRASGRVAVRSNSKGAALFKEGTWILDATVFLGDGSTVELTEPVPVPAPRAILATATAIAAAQPTVPATRNARSTVASQSATATAEARAVQKVTATAQARAVAQSILATQAPWQPLWVESFADNSRGWPTGLQQDEFIAVTSVITNGKYVWTVNPKQGDSYWNLIPTDGEALTDFSAAVSLRLIRGNDEGSYAYGLVFRHMSDDYGFFGLQNNGKFRVLVVYDTGIYQDITQSAPAIRTQPGQANRFAVRAIGSNFVFLINDQVVWQLVEDMAPGEIGLGVDVRSKRGEAQVEFTDLQVHAP